MFYNNARALLSISIYIYIYRYVHEFWPGNVSERFVYERRGAKPKRAHARRHFVCTLWTRFPAIWLAAVRHPERRDSHVLSNAAPPVESRGRWALVYFGFVGRFRRVLTTEWNKTRVSRCSKRSYAATDEHVMSNRRHDQKPSRWMGGRGEQRRGEGVILERSSLVRIGWVMDDV